MRVPDWLRDLGARHCEDVVKVFVTTKLTSFPSLILPEIPLHVRHHGGVLRYDDELSTFLTDLTAPLRGQDDLGQEAWATQNFIIRTKVNENECN